MGHRVVPVDEAQVVEPMWPHEQPGVRVTYQGTRLPFRLPEVPAWLAVSVMSLAVVAMAFVASLVVLSGG